MFTLTHHRTHALAAALLSLAAMQQSNCDATSSRTVPNHCDPLPAEVTTLETVSRPDAVEDALCNANFIEGPPAPVGSGFGVKINQGFVRVDAALEYVDGTRKQCEAKIDGRGTGVGKKDTVCALGANRFEDQDGVWKCKRPVPPDVRQVTSRPREQCLRDIKINIRTVDNVNFGGAAVYRPRPEDNFDVSFDLLRVEGAFVGLAESVSSDDDRVAVNFPNPQRTPPGDPCLPPNCLLLEVTTGKQSPVGQRSFTLTSPGGFNTASAVFRVGMLRSRGRSTTGDTGDTVGTGTDGGDTGRPPRTIVGGGTIDSGESVTPAPVSGVECGCQATGDYVEPAALAPSAAGVTLTADTRGNGTHALLLQTPTCVFSHVTNSANAAWGFSPHGKYFVVGENRQNIFGNNLRILVYNLSTCHPFVPYDSTVYAAPVNGWDAAGWGFGPDAEDRSMVIAAQKDTRTVDLRLVNMPRAEVRSLEILSGDAVWRFSPCGDLLAVKKVAAQNWLSFRWWRVSDFGFFAERSVSLSGNVREAEAVATPQNQVLRSLRADGTSADETVGQNTAAQACP